MVIRSKEKRKPLMNTDEEETTTPWQVLRKRERAEKRRPSEDCEHV